MITTTKRTISQTWQVKLERKNQIHTAGLVLPMGEWKRFDPFLVMAEDIFGTKAFGPHPHRGMETVTFVIEGELHHKDNKGGQSVLHAGDAQWMTAGSGLIHLEAPPENTVVHTLQLWVNLPKAHKMTVPRYQNILSNLVPVRKEEGVTYRVYSGNSGDVVSPTKNYASVTMVEILVEAGYTASQDLPSEYKGFVYVLEGSGVLGSNKVKAAKGEVAELGHVNESTEHSIINISATENLRVILFAGKPLNEQVIAGGPFVMNTEEEIQLAYADFRGGKFGEPIFS